MLYVAGKAFEVGALIFSTITVLASGMAAHAGVARLMYVMGRDGVFPKSFFGYVHPTRRTPAMNIIWSARLRCWRLTSTGNGDGAD